MQDFVFLSVTNSPYIPVVEKLLVSLNEYHPDIGIHLVCVNMSHEEIHYVKGLHKNITPIIVEQKFEKMRGDRELGPNDSGHEEGYCTSCRSWFMLDLMNELDKSVFYLDADVYLKGNIDELFPKLKEADFMIRAKNLDPKNFKCNAGMVWVKDTPLNRKLVEDWADKTRKMGATSWRSNQWTLDELIRENWEDINYRNFPIEFNGKTDNPESIIVHVKGPK